jgi:signal transduction histidine kinase/CheY-like chemotaxis protein
MGDDVEHTAVRRLRSPTEPTEKVVEDKALLIEILGNDAGRTCVIVVGESLTIGRSPEADLCIVSDDVSRDHSRITGSDEGFFIEDLGSRNGTLLNGVFIEEQTPLKYGDKIRIGSKTLFVFTRYDTLEDRLLQAQRLESIGRLAGGVAHDFNNTLGVLLANVGFLQGLAPEIRIGDANIRESLRDMEISTKRAVQVTRQLLSFSREEQPEQRPVELGAVVDEVARLIRRTFDPAIRLSIEVQTNLHVSGDFAQLQQLLMNLSINARDAMPSGGELSIVGSRVQLTEEELNRDPLLHGCPYVSLEVTDTGHGMDQMTKKRIFEPFFTTKSRSSGTGLGLFTAFQIVRQHGGTIHVDSKVSGGTTFEVLIPALERSSKMRATTIAPDVHPRRKTVGGVILVVDDDEAFCNSTRRLLEGFGYTAKAVTTGVEAIRLFEDIGDGVELVLLDISMPDMNGAAVFEELRRIRPRARVLIVSGLTDISGARELLTRGAAGFLQKPYDGKTLERTIAGILRSY